MVTGDRCDIYGDGDHCDAISMVTVMVVMIAMVTVMVSVMQYPW